MTNALPDSLVNTLASTLVQQLIDAATKGNMQRLHLHSGECLTGWIMEITDSQLVISTGQSESQGTDLSVPITDIQANSIQYWDVKSDSWVAA